jgi:hypothetical protein
MTQAARFFEVFTTVTWVTVLVNNPFDAGWFAFHAPLQSLSLLLLVYGAYYISFGVWGRK